MNALLIYLNLRFQYSYIFNTKINEEKIITTDTLIF